MAVEQLRELVERTGRSVRSLEMEAGAPEGRLAYWLRPATVVHRPPRVSDMEELARIIGGGTTLLEVSRAFAAAAGLILDDITEPEFRLVIRYRRLDGEQRDGLLELADDPEQLELAFTLRRLPDRDRETVAAMARYLLDRDQGATPDPPPAT